MNSRVFRIAIAAVFLVAAAGNLALLSKYNIYVGDDGYLASYLYEYHFTGNRSFIFCLNWPIHQFLVATLGPVYRWIYDAHLTLLELVGAKYYRINALSAILFLITYLTFILTVIRRRGRWLILVSVVIFGTLEPFLVMSHSIRTESVMLLALALGAYGLSRNKKDLLAIGCLFLATIIIVNTHLGGWPLLAGLAAGTCYLLGVRALLLYLGGCGVALLVYLVLNDLASIEALRRLITSYWAQNSVSTYTRLHVLGDLADYFLAAKYKRHLIELLLIGAFLAAVLRWQRLDRVGRALIVTTIASFLAYVVLFSYINPYYLVYFYFLMLLVVAWSGGDLLPEGWGLAAGGALATPFVILYAAILVMFLKSPGWQEVMAQRDALLRHLPAGEMVAAPEYFVNLDPARRHLMVPLDQMSPGSGCLVRHSDPRSFGALIADTRHKDLVSPYLDVFQLTDRIHIGRLATQSLSDNGDLLVYTRRQDKVSAKGK